MKIEEILQSAKEKKSSDIHIMSENPLMFRIDGELLPQSEEVLTPEEVEEMLSDMMTKEQNSLFKQNGELDFAFSLSRFFRVRVNVYRQRGTLAAAIRMLSFDIPSPKQLSIPKEMLNLTEKKKGLVFVTGAAGSGKSTTLASLIDLIARRDVKNIITIEDPIEYLHSGNKSMVSQREIGGDTKSYATALRAALRQDPDVIYVGDLTDMDTINLAITAAETGHLVFASLHTSRASDTINRLIEVFPPHNQQQVRVQLAEVVEGVIAQQLLPRTDSNGRTGVFEIMLANNEIRNAIREGKTTQIPLLIENGRSEGMQTMDEAILGAYMKSQITAETAISFAQDIQEMERKVQIY